MSSEKTSTNSTFTSIVTELAFFFIRSAFDILLVAASLWFDFRARHDLLLFEALELQLREEMRRLFYQSILPKNIVLIL